MLKITIVKQINQKIKVTNNNLIAKPILCSKITKKSRQLRIFIE